MTAKYIWHVALGSGAATREPCGYSTEQLAAWRGHINAAITSQTGEPIPGQSGYEVAAQDIGGVLLCTVGRADDTTALITFCVTRRSQQARKAWQALHEGYPVYSATLDNVPQAPYCAVRAEQGLAYDQDATQWLDAYQLAIAWAWVEGR